ncbi:hypothetical protein [Nocardiopsis sp. Huas11]|uniref:hypothetical protein n=1 Tax=Nocardiopsis sp. Huas11 TaxID=2183912 RepID=UPI0011C4973F|nr:hypothetical protein [Nocardiopsis sp. Huas11]
MSEPLVRDESVGPFFDPSLDPRVIAALRERSDRLPRSNDTRARPRPPLLTPIAITAAGLLGTAALTATVFSLTAHVLATLAVLSLVLLAAGAYAAFSRRGPVRGLLSLIASAALAAPAGWLGTTGLVITVTSVAALAGLTGTVHLVLRHHERRLPAVYHGHYLVPQDFGAPERRLLARVGEVRRAVDEHAPTLGAHFDGAGAARTLAEQEWRLARFLRTQTELREDLEARSRAAVSATVRAALRPQAEAVRAAMDIAERRVRAIGAYGDQVSLAALKQREWEQVEGTRFRDHAYGDHLADAGSRVEDRLDTTELLAVQQVRDASVREAVEAGRRLSRAPGLG